MGRHNRSVFGRAVGTLPRSAGCLAGDWADPCQTDVYALGLCRSHHDWWRRHGQAYTEDDPCPDCGGRFSPDGLCLRCYDPRLRYGRQGDPFSAYARTCDLCGGWHFANGLCIRHYQRAWEHATGRRNPKVLKPCGTRAAWWRHRRRGEPPCPPCAAAYEAYKAEHATLARARRARKRAAATVGR